jgi:Holliday junction resolvase RusA-like endonuclease
MKTNKMKVEDYKNAINRVSSSGNAGTMRKNNAKAKVLLRTISAIRSVQTYNPDILFDGTYRIDIAVFGTARGDEDNIRKAFNDALQGTATRNDRDSCGGDTTLHDR